MDTILLHRKKLVSAKEIVFLQGQINYTKVHFESGKIIMLAKTLKKLEVDFSPFGFFRINKASIINLRKVQSMFDDYSCVVLDNHLELNVSRRRRTNFRNTFRSFKEKILRQRLHK